MSKEQIERGHLPTCFLLDAARDYASARCLLLSGLPGGFPLAAQASEKLLKGYLLMLDPDFPLRRLSHELSKLLSKADKLSPRLNLSRIAGVAQKFEKYYYTRYPDNPDWPQPMDTSELAELDEFTMVLNQNLTYWS
jgi:HEPN domain-containing protein